MVSHKQFMACLPQELSSETWRAALQAEQRAVKDKVASVVQAGFTAFGAQCDLLSQRPKQDAAALAELMTPVLVEKVQPDMTRDHRQMHVLGRGGSAHSEAAALAVLSFRGVRGRGPGGVGI